MILASTKRTVLPPNTRAMRFTVSGLTALQSANASLGFPPDASCAFLNASAKETAELGGMMLRIQSARRAMSASDASSIPAFIARSTVAGERPSSVVRTVHPALVNLLATAAPMDPGAITAMVGADVIVTRVRVYLPGRLASGCEAAMLDTRL